MVSTPSGWFSGLGLAFLLGVLGAGQAFADESADKKRAQDLFMEGRTALDKGDKVRGCALMRESLELFAVANALFNIAICDEDDGKIASALEHWERGLALVDAKDPRASVAREHIATLGPRVPRLRIVMPKDQQISEIIVDGKPLSPSARAEALYLEPGKHVIVVQSPGWKDRQHDLVLAERERTEFLATRSSVADPSAGTPGPTEHPVETPLAASSGRRTAGIVVLGVGALGLIGAGISGVGVMSADTDIDAIDDSCKRGDFCDLEARRPLVSSYRTLVWVNTAAWGVGLAGATVGAIMILTAPDRAEKSSLKAAVAPAFYPGGAGLDISGRF